ncbi:sensor histidine kinase [Agromyces sp. NPDC060279]|uniref:sensor histidine kinase n=1 Tax=Agromyces sp. NPDC060279 TaxID=3347092 RepID=UPI003656FCF4
MTTTDPISTAPISTAPSAADTNREAMSTEPASTQSTPAPSPTRRRGYGALWASVPRELGFLILTMPIAVIGLSFAATVFFTGVGLLAIVVGVFVMVGAFYVARGFGTLELVRLEWAGRPRIERPDWARDGREAGFWRAAFVPFVDGHYWLYVLHTLIINPIVSIFTWTVTVVWLAMALGGTTGWFWQRFIPESDRGFWLNEWLLDRFFPGNDFSYDVVAGERLLEFVLGVVFLLTLPIVFRGLTLLHDAAARGLLGAWRSEALEVEVAQLAASRGAAVQAEDASLRRLERDIHDGPQQRLVRLQMDLATIERRMERDPDAARELIGEAREQARETLDELRALSRGFAPPLLQDRGLASALESLASRSPVPVVFENLLPGASGLPAAIERNAYFVAAELLTNVVKHSDATSVRLRVAVRDAGPAGHWLDLWVTDNGSGGARLEAGHGLAGLHERVLGLRGQFLVDSPPGGPTIIGAHIPFLPEPPRVDG